MAKPKTDELQSVHRGIVGYHRKDERHKDGQAYQTLHVSRVGGKATLCLKKRGQWCKFLGLWALESEEMPVCPECRNRAYEILGVAAGVASGE